MKPIRLATVISIILPVIFISQWMTALGNNESQELSIDHSPAIPTAQPVEIGEQNASNVSALFLPVIQRPEKRLPRVNVPYFNGDVRFPETAIFWLGKVTPTDNYADVRIGYNNTEIYVNVTIIDRRLWYDKNPSPASLADWDAITLYLNLNGAIGSALDPTAYKFVSQLNWWEARDRWQASYQGNSTGWSANTLPFNTQSDWRGNAPNDNTSDKGWVMKFHIPFTSLGLSGPPAEGTIWGLAVSVHDRDDASGTPISDKVWPPGQLESRPETWGQLRFGLPGYTAPQTVSSNVVTIRHKLSGAVVTDGEVGGHTDCGLLYDPIYFNGWGDANYTSKEQINIQNQADVADWNCFSKFFIVFPLPGSLSGQAILSAKLRLYQFGGSNPSQAQPSLIQVMTVKGDWQEDKLTWNNAPIAQENVGQAWVNPILQFPGWPGVPIDWDISRAVSEAVQNGETQLRLVLYDSDGAQHSGKYFITSDTGNWNEIGRPTLTITSGQ